MPNQPLPRSRPPLLAYLVLCVLLLGGLLLLVQQLDPQARAARETAAFRQAQIDDQLVGVDVFLAVLWRVVPLIGVWALLITGLVIAYHRWGMPASIHAGYQVQALKAVHQPGQTPQSLTYSPHMAYKGLEGAPALVPALGEPESVIEVPHMAQLLTNGDFGDPKKLILGYSDHGPIVGSFESLYSTGLGGLQGSGKTSTAAFILAQSALAGAQLVIADPHAGDAQSLAIKVQELSPAFYCEVAEDERDILHVLKLAEGVLRARKQGDPTRSPFIVAIDEWSSLRRGELASVLPTIIESFSTEGRKLNCHVMLLGQRWDKQSVGDFRNTLASSYVHRMRPQEARMMTGLAAGLLPADTLRLAPGEAYLLDTRGNVERVKMPYMADRDLAHVGHLLQRESRNDTIIDLFPQESSGKSMGNHRESSTEYTKTALYGAGHDPETARIVQMFFSGLSIVEITKALYPDATTGRAYQDRRAVVEGALRKAFTTERAG